MDPTARQSWQSAACRDRSVDGAGAALAPTSRRPMPRIPSAATPAASTARRTFRYAWARAIRSPFGFVTSGGYHSTIGKVIGNKNVVLENIEYSTIRMHIELAREPNIHPKPILK